MFTPSYSVTLSPRCSRDIFFFFRAMLLPDAVIAMLVMMARSPPAFASMIRKDARYGENAA